MIYYVFVICKCYMCVYILWWPCYRKTNQLADYSLFDRSIDNRKSNCSNRTPRVVPDQQIAHPHLHPHPHPTQDYDPIDRYQLATTDRRLTLSDSALSTRYHAIRPSSLRPSLMTSEPTPTRMTSNRGFARGRSLKNLIVLGSSFMLWMTSFTSLQSLQSTLNPHDTTGGVTSVGVSSLLAIYVTTIFSCFAAPTVIRLLGAKWTVVGAYALFLVYVGANFFPTDYLMLPASVLFGAMAGPLWSAQSTYLTTLALHYARNTQEV